MAPPQTAAPLTKTTPYDVHSAISSSNALAGIAAGLSIHIASADGL
jgi:hypothetical protein